MLFQPSYTIEEDPDLVSCGGGPLEMCSQEWDSERGNISEPRDWRKEQGWPPGQL